MKKLNELRGMAEEQVEATPVKKNAKKEKIGAGGGVCVCSQELLDLQAPETPHVLKDETVLAKLEGT